MPTLVEVPEHGVVEFPDGMDDEQIAQAIKSQSSPASQVEPQLQSDLETVTRSAQTAPPKQEISSDFLSKPEQQPMLDAIDAALPPVEPLTPSGLKDFSPVDLVPEAATYLPTDEEAGAIARALNPALNAAPKETVDQIAGATLDTAEGLAKFPTTGLGVAAAGLASTGAVGATAVTGAFMVEGIKSLPDAWKAVTTASNAREMTSAIEGLGITLGMIASPVLHGMSRPRTPVESSPPAAVESPPSVQTEAPATAAKGQPTEAAPSVETQPVESGAADWTSATELSQSPEQSGLGAGAAKLSGPKPGDLSKISPAEKTPSSSPVKFSYVTKEGRDSMIEAHPEDAFDALDAIRKSGGEVHAVNGRIVGKLTAEQMLSPEPIKMKMRSGESGAIPSPTIPTRKMSELDVATAERSAKQQKSFDEAQRAQKEIKAVIPEKSRQEAASVYREANGDMTVLKDWETNAKQDWMRNAAREAQTLTPEEIAIVDKARAAFDVLEKRGNAYGVLGAHRENYIPHVWDVAKGKGLTGTKKLQERFKFAKARTFNTFFEGDQAGFKPKNFAIGDVLPAYLTEMNKVIADRQFVADLVKGKSKTGEPLAVPRGRVTVVDKGTDEAAVLAMPKATRGELDTSHYKTMADQPALSDWTWEGTDTEGKPVFVKAELALHPEAHKRLNAMLGKSKLRELYENAEGVAVIPASIVKGLDVAQSVMKREMFGLLAPFHQVQEGTHAIGHTVNPFGNIPKIDLREPAQMDAARHGLMLLPDRSTSGIYLEGSGGKGSFISQATRWVGEKAKSKAATAVADVIDGYQDYLFHQYIPGLKLKTYEAILERNTKLYDAELKGGKLSEKDIKLLSAEQANAAYGHLNYDLLDRDPTVKHFMQLALLAPDFLEARGKFAAQAAKTLTGSKAGYEQFRAIALLAVVQAGTAYTLAQLAGGEWDPKHPFEVVINNRRYAMRSVPEDIASAFTDPRKFIYARVSPLLAKGGIQTITGLNYRGEKTTSLETATELLAQYIPITARSLPGLSELNSTTRNNPTSRLEQYAGSLGLRISRYSPISETYKLAGEWMDGQKIPRDKGSYPVSKYSHLRYALEDADEEKALAEYAKLKETLSPAKIAKGFRESTNHPFTQSREMDAKFRAALKPEQREVFDLATKRRRELLWRFAKLKK